MLTFKQYVLERYNFGGTAFGLASIDSTTAQDQKKANAGVSGYQGFNQRVGSSGRQYVPAYSVASRTLPAGTIVKIVDKRTGEPVGKQFGNTEGIYRVDGTGGPQTKNNIDFFAGDNKEMYNYYANLGTNSNNLTVTPLNIQMNSEEERNLMSKLQQYQTDPNQVASNDAENATGEKQYENPIIAGLRQQMSQIFSKGFDKETAKRALDTALGTAWGAIKQASPKAEELIKKYTS